MKNIKFLMIGIAAVLIMTTGCEKESVMGPTADGHLAKSKTIINKSGSDIDWETIEQYAVDLDNQTNPATIGWDTALLYIESAINYNIASGASTGEKSIISYMAVQLTINDNDQIDGNEANLAYSEIKAFLESALGDTEDPDAKVLVVDLDLDNMDRIGSTVTVELIAVVNHPAGWGSSCYFTNTWRAAERLGNCDIPGMSGADAADQITWYLNSCMSGIGEHSEYLQVGFTSKYYSGENYSTIWSGTLATECIAPNNLVILSGNIWTIVQNNNPSSGLLTVRNVIVKSKDGGTNTSPFFHEALAFYAIPKP